MTDIKEYSGNLKNFQPVRVTRLDITPARTGFRQGCCLRTLETNQAWSDQDSWTLMTSLVIIQHKFTSNSFQFYQQYQMHGDEENLLDMHVSHYFIHVSQPSRILEVSEENLSDDSIIIHEPQKDPRGQRDSLDGHLFLDLEVKNIESIVQEYAVTISHMDVRDFVRENFGESNIQLITVGSFASELIEYFKAMLPSNDAEKLRSKLVQYLRIKMGGSLIDLEKLNNLTRTSGLIGLVSSFLDKAEVAQITRSQKNNNCIYDIQSIIKSYAEKLFMSLERQIDYKLQQQASNLSKKYNQVHAMLQRLKSPDRKGTLQAQKLKDQTRMMTKRISELESLLRKSDLETRALRDANLKLNEQNFKLSQRLDKLMDLAHRSQDHPLLSHHHSLSNMLPSPTNNSFDKSKFQHGFNIPTPKSKKSQFFLQPLEMHNRSKSSSNLDLNLTTIYRDNPQQKFQSKRLRTQQAVNNDTPRSINNHPMLKKNSQSLCPKPRPVNWLSKHT